MKIIFKNRFPGKEVHTKIIFGFISIFDESFWMTFGPSSVEIRSYTSVYVIIWTTFRIDILRLATRDTLRDFTLRFTVTTLIVKVLHINFQLPKTSDWNESKNEFRFIFMNFHDFQSWHVVQAYPSLFSLPRVPGMVMC